MNLKPLIADKRGKNDQMTMLISVLVVIGILIVGSMFFTNRQQTQLAKEGVTPGTTGACALDSPLTVLDISKIAGGTAPSSPTITAGIVKEGDSDGENSVIATSITSGNTYNQFVGKKVAVLVSDGDSLDEKFIIEEFDCGGETIGAEGLYYSSSADPAITIKDTDTQVNDLTDATAGGPYNATAPTTGTSFDVDVKFQSTSLESSGDGIWVVEFPAGSAANITDGSVSMSDALGSKLNIVSKPKLHTQVNAGSELVAFEVPMIKDGASKVYTLKLDLDASKDLSGAVLTDWYAKQYFIDDDSTLAYGIEDSDGTAKHENNFDDDFLIV